MSHPQNAGPTYRQRSRGYQQGPGHRTPVPTWRVTLAKSGPLWASVSPFIMRELKSEKKGEQRKRGSQEEEEGEGS